MAPNRAEFSSLFCLLWAACRATLQQGLFGAFLCFSAMPAMAVDYVFPGNLPAACSGSGPNYSCTDLSLGYGDTLTLHAPKPATITVNGNLYTSNAQINASGSAADLTLVVTGSMTTDFQANIQAHIQASSLSDVGGQATFGGAIAVSSGDVNLSYQTSVLGNVSSTTGAIAVGTQAQIGGDLTSSAGGTVTVKFNSLVTGSVRTSGAISIESLSRVGGSVTGETGAIHVQYQAEVSGSVSSTTGTILMDGETVAGACVGSSGSASITLNYQAQIGGVCCGATCGNSCVTNNSMLPMPAACAIAQTCIGDALSSGTLDTSLWNVLKLAGPFTPQVVSVNSQNRLRLTDARNAEATMVQLKKWFPAAGNKLVVQFDYHVYGGNGADGVVVAFSDASVPPAPGAGGGSLGYAQSVSTAGFAGGWLGIGIDEFGNYPNNDGGKQAYPAGWTAPSGANVAVGFRKNSVAVRGSGSGTTGYHLLANAGTLSPAIWSNTNTSSTAHRYRITIDNSNNSNAFVTVERDTTASGNSFATIVPAFDVLAANSGQSAVPANLLMSLTSGTGGANNIHEMSNISVCAAYINDPGNSASAAAFDCLETGVNTPWVPSTSGAVKPLYTKLTSTNFSFDVAALRTDGNLESNYVAAGGNPKSALVELFDNTTPAASCSAYASPVASKVVTFESGTFSGTAGRVKTANFSIASARSKLLCRVKECTTAACTAFTTVPPACATDQFAVRPKQFAVTAPSMNNATLSGAPSAKAGAVFTLEAAAGVTSGYSGTPGVDASKVLDHNAVAIASATLSGSFAAGNGAKASGTSFTYQDVGSLQFLADAVVDSTFTAVDQSHADCVVGSTSNTLNAGKYGCDIGSVASAKLGRWYPSHYSFSGTLTPSCAAGGFTYMDEDALGVSLTVKAHASSGGAASASDPVVSRYTTGYPRLAPITFSGDNAGMAVAVTRLESPAFAAMPNTSLWSAGQLLINDSYAFAKLTSPDGPYDSFKLKASIADPDGSIFVNTTNETNSTRIRHGQLRMSNVYGSERINLPVPLEARYWNGALYVTNTLDSCTTLSLSSIALSNYTGNLAACETQISPATVQTLTNGKLPGSGLVLSKPGQGNSGSVQLTLNVGSTATGSTCMSASASGATAAQRYWFGSNPSARASFGIFRSPLIYLRENY